MSAPSAIAGGLAASLCNAGLRDYQQRLIALVQREYRDGARSVMMQSGTGTGKTHMAARGIIAPCAARGLRTLFLADLEELIDDTAGRLRALGLSVGIVKAGRASDSEALVQVCSVQTLTRRMARGELPEADRIIVDEAQLCAAPTARALLASYPRAKLLGLSVGPDSWVEMRGGPFGAGFVGSIEKAYNTLAQSGVQSEPLGTFDCLRVEHLNVEARGWLGNAFGWKRVKSCLRHVCDRPVRTVRASSARLLLTDDHSVYRVEGRRKDIGRFACRPSANIESGDVLPMDDGHAWGSDSESPIDVLNLIGLARNHVAVDLSNVERITLGVSPSYWHSARSKGAHGHHLSARIYVEHRSHLPRATKLYTEGARGHWLAPSFRLSDWAYVLGFWLGNGWLCGARVCFSVKNANAEAFVAVLRALPHVGWGVKPRQMQGSVEVRCNSGLVAKLFRALFGKVEAPQKSIPSEWITTWSETARRELLRGLTESDGHESFKERDRERVHFASTSPKLARGVCTLLRSLGVSAGAHEKKPSNGGIVGGRQIVGKHASTTVHWSLHALRGDNEGHRGLRRRFDHGSASFNEGVVLSAEPATPPKFVYDLEMEGHPSFVADGVLVHNSATPSRGDGQPLDAFERIVCGPSIRWMQDNGYLVRARVFAPDRVLERGVAEDPVQTYLKRCVRGGVGRRAVFFAANSHEARRIAREVTGAGYQTQTVLSGMPADFRRRVRDHMRAGAIINLVSCRALLKGFDLPLLDTAIIAQAQHSVSDHLQSIGRVLRVDPENPLKTYAEIYDLRGASVMHGHPEDERVWDLSGTSGRRSEETVRAGLRRCAQCHAMFSPCDRCPVCGAVRMIDLRPLAIQRAEMREASGEPAHVRAERNIARGIEVIRRRKPQLSEAQARFAVMKKAPSWMREALASVEAMRVDALQRNTSGATAHSNQTDLFNDSGNEETEQ